MLQSAGRQGNCDLLLQQLAAAISTPARSRSDESLTTSPTNIGHPRNNADAVERKSCAQRTWRRSTKTPSTKSTALSVWTTL